MSFIPQEIQDLNYIYYYGNSYEPYSFIVNGFALITGIAQAAWNILLGPEFLLIFSGQLADLKFREKLLFLLAKYMVAAAWNFAYFQAFLRNYMWTIVSSIGNLTISSYIMIIYLLVQGENVEPIDFEEKMTGGKYRLNLIDGTFFHYF